MSAVRVSPGASSQARAAGRADMPVRIAFGAYALLLLGTQFDVLAGLWRTWQSDAYGHGLLLVPIALWLLWRDRDRWLARPAAPRLDGALIAAGALVGLLLADLLQIEAVAQTLLFVALAAGARGLLGPAATPLLFPLLLPLLAVSLWDLTLAPLQQVTVVLTVAGMALTPVPVFVDQNYLTIPEGRFVVETTCAGLRYLLAGLTLAVLHGHLFLPTWRRQVLFVAVTALWVVLLNGVRVVVVILMGHTLGMNHPWVVDHGDAGWVIFAVGLLPLLLLGRRLEHGAGERSPAAPDARTAARAIAPAARRSAAPAALLLALVVALPLLERAAEARSLPLQAFAGLPLDDCGDGAFAGSGWAPHFAQPDRERCGIVGAVQVYVAQWRQERPGAELVFYANDPLAGLASRGPARRTVRRTGPFEFRETLLGGAPERVVWTSYLVAGHSTASEVEAKVRRLQALAMGGFGSALLALQVPVGPEGLDAARARLAAVLAPLADAPPARED